MNNWEKLCDLLEPQLNTKNVPEELFQRYFVKALKDIFNWDRSSIKEQVPVRMGSTDKFVDILLEGIDFGIVIEMKRPGISLGTDQIKQLISYMHDLDDSKYKYGFLIGNTVTVLHYDKKSDFKPVKVIAFGFDSNNSDGIALGEILDKNVCSDEKLKGYVDEIIRRKRIEDEEAAEKAKVREQQEKLKKKLLVDNGKQAKEWIKAGYKGDEYTDEDFNNVLEGIEIEAKDDGGDGCVVPPPSPPVLGQLEILLLPDDETFRAKLLGVKRARRTIYYTDGRIETDTWEAYKITKKSNIRGNISSKYRDWKKENIFKVTVEVVGGL